MHQMLNDLQSSNDLPVLGSSTSDVYGSLLNNGLYVTQPNLNMDLDVIRSVMGWYYRLVWAVYIQSPQVAYVDLYLEINQLLQISRNTS